MAELADVRMWDVQRGVGHVIYSANSGWTYRLCSFGPGSPHTWSKTQPKRICKKCRVILKHATVLRAQRSPSDVSEGVNS